MTSRLALATALSATLVAAPVFAQESIAPAPVAAVETSAAPAKQLALGVQLELLPLGSMDVTLASPVINGTDSSSTYLHIGLGGGTRF